MYLWNFSASGDLCAYNLSQNIQFLIDFLQYETELLSADINNADICALLQTIILELTKLLTILSDSQLSQQQLSDTNKNFMDWDNKVTECLYNYVWQ